jgi:hypothetical protein
MFLFFYFQYLGSVYYEGETMFTVLWRLTSLKSNFLRYFPSFITGKPVGYDFYD